MDFGRAEISECEGFDEYKPTARDVLVKWGLALMVTALALLQDSLLKTHHQHGAEARVALFSGLCFS